MENWLQVKSSPESSLGIFSITFFAFVSFHDSCSGRIWDDICLLSFLGSKKPSLLCMIYDRVKLNLQLDLCQERSKVTYYYHHTTSSSLMMMIMTENTSMMSEKSLTFGNIIRLSDDTLFNQHSTHMINNKQT